jgi:hypothetical protein
MEVMLTSIGIAMSTLFSINNPICYYEMENSKKSMRFGTVGVPNHQPENLMDTQIMVVFCLCADMLTSLHHYKDQQCQMSDAEVMTTAIIAML